MIELELEREAESRQSRQARVVSTIAATVEVGVFSTGHELQFIAMEEILQSEVG